MADVLEWSEAISQGLGYEPGLYLERYEKLKKIQNKHSSSYDPLIYFLRKIYFDIFIKPESENLNRVLNSTEKSDRQRGYVVWNYKKMNDVLKEYADEEEYNTKASNKLRPQNSSIVCDKR